MLKIGEFSKLSQMTVKALRFYEKEGFLIPASVDEWTGYRFYTTEQLATAARIKSYRQLDLSIEEIKAIFKGKKARKILEEKAKALVNQQKEIDVRLSIINHILEKDSMKYQITIKEIPEMTVYYWEKRLAKYSDMMQVIPEIGEEVRKYNPDLNAVNRFMNSANILTVNIRKVMYLSDMLKQLKKLVLKVKTSNSKNSRQVKF